MPRTKRLTPVRNVGPRWMYLSASRMRQAGTTEARPGTGGIRWASCLMKPPKPIEPEPPKMVIYTATPAGGFKILVPEMVNFNDPCK